MSAYERRPYLPAVVGPRACLVIRRQVGELLERHAAAMAASPVETNREAADELVRALASMREAELQWRARVRGAGSDSGTTELPPVDAGAESAMSPPVVVPVMSVREVAERQRVSPTYVTRLCRTGVLSATRAGRVWLIDARSVADFEAKRRPVA